MSLSERIQKHSIMGPWKYVLAFLLKFIWRNEGYHNPQSLRSWYKYNQNISSI